MLKITGDDVQGMVAHWLHTPVNGFLGSSYGNTLQDMLMTPQTEDADEFVRKLRRDVPIVGRADNGSVNVFSENIGPDRRKIRIAVGDYVFIREG